MTNQQHPITPPPELVQQWMQVNSAEYEQHIATRAAQWGANQELEACCAWVEREIGHGREWNAELRTARCPQPPSLKEQALAIVTRGNQALTREEQSTIRCALEQLND